jgi:CRP/FNR family transcriptional regulator, cyclic AMP receptor protein
MTGGRCVRRVMKFESGLSVSQGFDNFLREIPLFADLDPRALSHVQLVAQPFQVDAGTTLFRQGDSPDGLYLIKHGEIDILRRVPGDEAVRLAVLGRSAIVGEMSSLDHNPRSTNAVATLPTSGYFISYQRLQILQSDFSDAAFAVMNCFRRELAARARMVIDRIDAFVVADGAPPASPASSCAAKWPSPASPSTINETLLQSLPFFRTFGLAELREFIAPLKRFDFTPGQLLYPTGEAPRSCLLIVRGALSMNCPTATGVAMFSVRGPGQMMGELALMDGGPQPLDCMAREPTIAFELDRIQFELLRRGGSMMALRFFKAVTSSIVATLRKANAHFARLAAERSSAAALASAPLVTLAAAELS